MAKKPKIKTDILSVRISPKMRYGIELAARKEHLTLSDAVTKAIDAYLERNGITVRMPGESDSLLDKVWHENELLRILSLKGSAPNLATDEELGVIAVFEKLSDMMEEFELRLKDAHGDNPDIRLGVANALNYLHTTKGMDMMKRVVAGKTSLDDAFDEMNGKDRTKE